ELDIEDPTVIAAVLSEAGANVSGFEVFLAGEGVAELEHIMDDAHERGVFGVPSFIIDGQLYWGSENLPFVREHLAD
ncbi:MAG: DsbA family protein, partial [Pseudomonadota bacterium]|nr:DsbA family protein [Pseudomonadota bacterium]